MTSVPEHVEEVVSRAAARTELALENSERRLLEATARRFAELADTITATGEAVEDLKRRFRKAEETDERVQETLRQMRESLTPRIAEVLTDVQRSREAIDAFQWETSRRGRPLPWEERGENG